MKELDIDKLRVTKEFTTGSTKEALKDVVPIEWSEEALSGEGYCTVEESLEESLKEMQLMRQGKMPKRTWREMCEEL